MLSETRDTPVQSPAPGVIPATVTGPVSDGGPVVGGPGGAPARSTAQAATGRETRGGQAATGRETRGGRFRRKAHRGRLHGYAIATAALVAYLIALAASNTAHVTVNWVFGSSHVSLVWLVLFAAIVGWLLGLATSARFHWRTRAPRARRSGS